MIIHLVTDRLSLGGGLEHIYQIVRGLDQIDFRVYGHSSGSHNPGQSERVRDKFRDLTNVTLVDTGFGPEIVLGNHPDLIHIHHLRPLLRFFLNPWKKYPMPLIFTAHGLHLHKYEFHSGNPVKGFENRIKYRLRFQLEKRLFNRVDRVIAVSREDQFFLEQRYRLTNVTYLTNGIDMGGGSVGDQTRDGLRKSLKLPEDHFLFVTVARFNFQKAYDFLIRTLSLLKDFLKRNRVKFILVGGGEELESIRLLADKLGVSPYIHFLGEREDARRFIRAADAFLLPSRWEGLPIVILECGLLKVPVIASDTYGNREIIGNKNGVLFRNLDKKALADTIQSAVNGHYEWKNMTESLNREVREHYSIEKMLLGLKQLYESRLHHSRL